MQAILSNASAEQGIDLVVFAQSSRLTQPGKSLSHNPTLGQRLKTMPLTALDHLHVPAEHAQRPIDQTARVVAPTKSQQQSHCVCGYVALAPFDSFACVISALPLFEMVLTDWESMMVSC